MDSIVVRGARTHNLRDLDLDIPRDRLVVITGLSGSGKSSLAFDTLYAEGQRRYVESLSTYARQFLSMMEKPDVDHIEGLSPAIAIEQKSTSHNPRSTVGTITEIHDYLRLLYARAGEPRCPEHDAPLAAQTIDEMVGQVLSLPEGARCMLLAPVVREKKGSHGRVLEELRSRGFVRVRLDGKVTDLDELPELDKRRRHSIDVVVDRFRVRDDLRNRLAESLETALEMADQTAVLAPMEKEDFSPLVFSARFACPQCGYSIATPEPRLFSFNNPAGACPSCDGLGSTRYFDPERVVHAPELSLAEGAIRGWNRSNAHFFRMLSSLARHLGFDLDQPFETLPEEVRQKILYGTGSEEIAFEYLGDGGHTVTRHHPFEGVLPNMERRYRETASDAIREELARYLATHDCPDCGGTRLCQAARHVVVAGCSLPEVLEWPVQESLAYFDALSLPGHRGAIAERILREIRLRLRFLVDVGLGYLTLARSADSLSGGEAQRIRLASQIGAGLVGVMYVLDEPSIGLHQRDNARLLDTLQRLCALGNSVLVVEHDEEAIRCADHVIDMGPGAGIHGGQVLAQGTVADIEACEASLTGDYLSGRRAIPLPRERRRPDARRLVIRGARGNNLRSLRLELPLGLLTCVTGVSGSGKSTLINHTLYPEAARRLNRAAKMRTGAFDEIQGLEHLDKVINIDQSPIGRTPRSNPATYVGLFGTVRELFAGTPEARARGYKPGRFSFNTRGGRCETCRGDGVIRVEMHFLPDLEVPCEACNGRRYNRETLEVTYKGRNIHEVLDMTIEEGLDFFAAVPALQRRLQTLMEVGLGYVHLGQSATTLSGGEAQRVKLARELSRRDSGRTLYILDEPTTGLHFHDIRQLLDVLFRLRERGNTVVVIEHNLDVIKTADHVVDLGPEGGEEGGRIVAEGTPEEVAECPDSHTGRFLAPLLTDPATS